MNWTVVSHRDILILDQKRQMVICVRSNPGRLARFFGVKPKEREFTGDGTVWHEMPAFRRASIHWELRLSEFQTKIRHGQDHGWACDNFVASPEDPVFCKNCGDFGSRHKCGGAFHSFRTTPKP